MKHVSIAELSALPIGTMVLGPLHGTPTPPTFMFMVKSEKDEDGCMHLDFSSLEVMPKEDKPGEYGFVPSKTSCVFRHDEENRFLLVDSDDCATFLEMMLPSMGRGVGRIGPYKEKENGDIHVDDWLDRTPMYFKDDDKIFNYVHFMLNHFRYNSTWKSAHREAMSQHKLFVTYEGKRYRVTGASRMGDVWLHSNFEETHTYEHRVSLNFKTLTDWSATP